MKRAQHLPLAFLAVAVLPVALFLSNPTPLALADSTAAQPDWGYGASNGPEHWGDLKPEYRMCKDGKQQSPVNFESKLDAIHGVNASNADAQSGDAAGTKEENEMRVNVTMPPMSAVNVTNLGHTVRWTPADGVGRSMNVGNVAYSLVQFHVHTPSEHRIDNMYYDAEMHFVHSSTSGHLAVLGFLIEATDANNTDFQAVLDDVPKEEGDSEMDTDRFTATNVLVDLLGKGGYFTYNGSLTSPPCSDNVRWVVAASPLQLGRLQIKQLARTVGFSARPPQVNEDLLRHRRSSSQRQNSTSAPSHLNGGDQKSSSDVVRASRTVGCGVAFLVVWALASWL
ncbi:alpha carbonic anhydrase [Catenaria anguillulae PL171]|uniref:Carbonic anhydrase n=1 Tax=Catenaria anguillulae PL171 TaxID=765915 RepID=A0A1Y2I1I6_9FUNG|nr:alpha carbonic anhydrase [Catenaria anguillulae PL171]